jgi:phage baseplate assembly protein W
MSYTYSDFDSRLKITKEGSVLIKYDQDVIIQSIKTILATITGERVRSPLGSSLIRMLFEPVTQENVLVMKQKMFRDIQTYEPRVEILDLQVQAYPDSNRYEINMNLRIRDLGMVFPFTTNIRSFA